MSVAAHPPSRAATVRHWTANALVAAAAVAWILLLRPHTLGGPASYVLVSGHSMRPQIQTGDLVITHRAHAYRVGDVIAYRIPRGQPGAGARVIHRIIGGSPREGFRTQGDNRDHPDVWRPRPRDIEGRLWLRLPQTGHLIALLSAPIPLATAAGLLAFLMIGTADRRPRTSRPTPNSTLTGRALRVRLRPGQATGRDDAGS